MRDAVHALGPRALTYVFLQGNGADRELPAIPTRRSSDLTDGLARVESAEQVQAAMRGHGARQHTDGLARVESAEQVQAAKIGRAHV